MSNYAPVIHAVPDDRPDEAETVRNAEAVANALTALGYQIEIIPVDIDLSVFEQIAARDPVIVFNLVEGFRGDGRLGVMACGMLEHFGLPFTGAGAAAYFQSTSKILTKILLQAAELPAPRWWKRASASDGKVIIKSVYEHASFGIDQNSIVKASDAQNEISFREENFGGSFFAEEYISGREFNISVIELDDGPHVLPVAEMRFDKFPKGMFPIVDYAAKWDPTSDAYKFSERDFSINDKESELAERLRGLTLKCWAACGLCGYGRVDFRVNRAGQPFVLEINANPCLAPDAGFAAALKEAGFDYDDGIEAIVNAGRRARRR